MKQNISNDRLIESIVAKVKKMNDGDDMNVENELYYALDRVESASTTGDDYDLGSNLYWLLDGKTKERLRSFSHDRFTYTSHPWTAQCKYLPDGFLCATVGLKVYDEVAYPALISNANPNISVEISDPHSLQSIGEAYENLMNDVMNYYGELKEMQFAHRYMKSLLGILKKKNPDADWEHFSPRRIIEEIKNI